MRPIRTKMKLVLWLGLLLQSCLLWGCGLRMGVDVKTVQVATERPSNVGAYLRVSDGGEPVQGLTQDSFRVYEDDLLIAHGQSQLTLLSREEVAVHHLALLVDLGGELDEMSKLALASAVEEFVRQVRRQQGVSVFVFDGSEQIRLVGDFPKDAGGSPIELAAGFSQRDPSRNLHGAVLEARKALDARLMQVRRPIRIGALVVVARGADVAGRVPRGDLLDQLDEVPYDILAVGVEGDEEDFLEDIGFSGVVRVSADSELPEALQMAAAQVTAAYEGYYLVQYCSPARAGEREVRIEALFKGPEGEELVGDVQFAIDATGFGPGCNASKTPTFANTARSVEASEPGEDDADAAPPDASSEPPSERPRAKALPTPEAAATGGDDEIVPPPAKPGYE